MEAAHLQISSLSRVLGDRLLFSDISFSVRSGGCLFITGPSGVGKTLLLRLLACLDDAQVSSREAVGWQQGGSRQAWGAGLDHAAVVGKTLLLLLRLLACLDDAQVRRGQWAGNMPHGDIHGCRTLCVHH